MADERVMERRDESGLALVVALLVTMISFIIVTAVLAQAMHNISQAGYLRRRASAINAAEAGLNLYWKTLEKTSLLALQQPGGWNPNGSAWEYIGSDVASKPDSPVYMLRVRYFKENPCANADGTPRTCSSVGLTVQPLTDDPFPSTVYAIVRSIGCVPYSSDSVKRESGDCWELDSARSAEERSVRRSLETVMRLRTRYGGVSGSVTASYVCLDEAGKLTMSGDLYVMGAPMTGPPGWPSECAAGVVVGSGDELTMTDGNLYAAQGDLSVGSGGSMEISHDIWAKDQVILGDGTATAVSCADSTVKICVHGNATGSSVTIGSQAAVEGDTMSCDPACPPTVLEFPQIVWDARDWANWSISEPVSLSGAALTAAFSNPAARSVYHITGSGCVVDLSGTFTINVDLAIVGECRFEMNSSTQLLGTGTLLLMSLWPGNPGSPTPLPPSDCGGGNIDDPSYSTTQKKFVAGPRDIYMHNNPETAGPNFFVYTPCSLKIDNNQNPVKGQLVARFLWIKNQANVTLVSVSGGGGIDVPGIVSGFSQDVRYINEIPIAAALA